MTPVILCILAFATTYWAGKRSLGWGIVSLLGWGYFFGIIRANLLATAIYFVFDAAVLGLYLSQMKLFATDKKRVGALRVWILILMVWPALLVLLPFQPLLVALVGLRGSVLFIPMALAGAYLRREDLTKIAGAFAVLNLIALTFAVAEYFLGIQRFYPINAATALIYESNDVGQGFYRIPAIFANAHLYGGTMAVSLPYLIGGWEQTTNSKARMLSLMGIAAAMVGVLMSATRMHFLACFALAVVAVVNTGMSAKRRMIISVVLLLVAAVALRNERFQRFKSLTDTDSVESRISGSVNRAFLEILFEYPMGNGLGGGGTSIPYFLEGQVRNPIGMENEYVRILGEQGIIGLMLWIAFIVWFLARARVAFAKGPWSTGRRLAWCSTLFSLSTGFLGMGMLTAIPHTAIMLLGIGWTAVPMAQEKRERQQAALRQPVPRPRQTYRPVPTVGIRRTPQLGD